MYMYIAHEAQENNNTTDIPTTTIQLRAMRSLGRNIEIIYALIMACHKSGKAKIENYSVHRGCIHYNFR